MKLENQVCTLEQAKKLKDLGVVQGFTFFEWWETEFNTREGIDKTVILATEDKNPSSDNTIIYSAFNVAELGVMLSAAINNGNFKTGDYPRCDNRHYYKWYVPNKFNLFFHWDTEAIARAALIIHLLENNIITAVEVNKRLCNS